MQLDVRRALGAHLDDAGLPMRAVFKAALERRAEGEGIVHPLVLQPVQPRGLGEVQARGGGDVPV